MPSVGFFRGTGSGTCARFGSGQERPVLSALSGKDRWYKPMVKSSGGERESDGVVVPLIAGRNPAGGKGPGFGHAVCGGNCKGMVGETTRPIYPGDVYALR